MNKSMKIMLIALFLTGCASSAELNRQRNAEDDAVCKQYGARHGTDAYVRCRMIQQSRRDQDNANAAAAAMMAGQGVQRAFQPRPAMNCMTTGASGWASTTCY